MIKNDMFNTVYKKFLFIPLIGPLICFFILYLNQYKYTNYNQKRINILVLMVFLVIIIINLSLYTIYINFINNLYFLYVIIPLLLIFYWYILAMIFIKYYNTLIHYNIKHKERLNIKTEKGFRIMMFVPLLGAFLSFVILFNNHKQYSNFNVVKYYFFVGLVAIITTIIFILVLIIMNTISEEVYSLILLVLWILISWISSDLIFIIYYKSLKI